MASSCRHLQTVSICWVSLEKGVRNPICPSSVGFLVWRHSFKSFWNMSRKKFLFTRICLPTNTVLRGAVCLQKPSGNTTPSLRNVSSNHEFPLVIFFSFPTATIQWTMLLTRSNVLHFANCKFRVGFESYKFNSV